MPNSGLPHFTERICYRSLLVSGPFAGRHLKQSQCHLYINELIMRTTHIIGIIGICHSASVIRTVSEVILPIAKVWIVECHVVVTCADWAGRP
jgi:hypothetical protein